MTRIRYSKSENGNLLSKPIMCNGDLVVCTLTTMVDGFSFAVTSVSTGEVLVGGGSHSLAYTKTLAKQALTGLGVVFGDDIRNKTVTQSTEAA